MSEVKSLFQSGRLQQLRTWLVAGFPGPSVPPFTVAVWQDGRVIPLTGDAAIAGSSFGFGCLQETILAVLFCSLADEGALSLDDPITDHVPELAHVTRDGKVPRLSDLLSHSTGLWLDNIPAEEGMPLDWEWFCRLLVPRFAPGHISVHSLLDRALLVKIAERAVGRSVYAELRDRFFATSRTFGARSADGPLAACYAELYGSLKDIATFLDSATHTSWLDRARQGYCPPITQSSNVTPWVPAADGPGLFRLANGIFGQDGDHHTEGFVGLRVSPSSRTAVLGHFVSGVGRDHVLNRLVSDVMGVAPPHLNPVLGDLNGIELGDLPGVYAEIMGKQLEIEIAEGQFRIKTSRMVRALAAKIEPDGILTGRWAAPNLWIESQSFGREDLIGFRLARQLYVKGRNLMPTHDAT